MTHRVRMHPWTPGAGSMTHLLSTLEFTALPEYTECDWFIADVSPPATAACKHAAARFASLPH